MIRPDLLKAVMASLASHRYLAHEDFVVSEYVNSQKEPCLAVRYRYDKEILFKFHIPQRKTTKSRDDGQEAYRFHCTMRPGKEAVEETLFAEERDGMLAELRKWIERVYDDTVAAPLVRQFQEHARAIDQLTDRLNDLPDEPLSRFDIHEFSEGLERLKSELIQELKDQERDKEELRRKVENLAGDIEFLKTTLASMTKRQWGDLFTARVQKWKSQLNLRHLSAGAKVAKLLLPESAGATLDAVAQAIDGVVAVGQDSGRESKS